MKRDGLTDAQYWTLHGIAEREYTGAQVRTLDVLEREGLIKWLGRPGRFKITDAGRARLKACTEDERRRNERERDRIEAARSAVRA
jgi:DNA-binding PadR family transcriptional regulator